MRVEKGGDAPKAGGLKFMMRALKSPNYRLYFTGQGISLIGSWMTRIAASWLIYRLTGSAFLLGVVGFAGQIPSFLLAPFAGVFVDRWDKHRLLVITQALAMIQSLALGLLTVTGVVTIWHIIILSVFQGLINAFDMPARQALVVELVENPDDLSNAIALNSSMVNGARLLGPSIGGVIIAAVGEGWCFLIDGFSYIAVIISLLLMHYVARPNQTLPGRNTWHQLREGWSYVSGFAPIRSLLLLLAMVSLLGMPYTILMPVFASKILGGGSATLGWLMTASGVGALCGASYLASRSTVLGLGRLIPWAAGAFGAGLMAFSFSRNLWVSLALLIVAGFGFMVQMASINTILQTIVEPDKRGRVMSFYMMAFMGAAPFGSLIAGGLATHLGTPHTLLLGGAGCVCAALWFGLTLPSLREHVRPIYAQLGIIPEVAIGLEQAAELMRPPEK